MLQNTFRDRITADGGDNGGELAAQKCGPFGLVKSYYIYLRFCARFADTFVSDLFLILILYEGCRAPGKEKS